LRFAAVIVAVVAALLLIGSAVLYYSLAANIRNNVEGDFATDTAQSRYESATIGRMRAEILLADVGVLVVVGGGGFLLARRSLRPVRRNVEAQRQFVANASHELRTPLAIMKADIDVALDDPDDAPGHVETLRGNLIEVDRMTRLVDDMLVLSLMDAHQESIHPVETDLTLLLAGTVDAMRAFGVTRGVDLTLTSEPALGVWCDAEQLERAFANLIKNAVEHSRRGGVVDVTCHRSDKRGFVVVRDHGEGIAGQDLPHVFERYFRADLSRSRARGGGGLGLPIARLIVRRHHGDIVVDSTPGEGTSVTVSLPRAAPSSSLHPSRVR
jgi:two-component system OmpR family sensor kinase